MKKIFILVLFFTSIVFSSFAVADCSGIKLVRYWTTGGKGGLFSSSNHTVFARLKNTSGEAKFVYLKVKNTNQWSPEGPFKTYSGDISDHEVTRLSNYDHKVKISYCE